MGNCHSDAVEKDVHNVIKWVPVVGQAYSGARAVAYLCKNDKAEAANALINTIPYVGPAITHITDTYDSCSRTRSQVMTSKTNVWESTFDRVTKWLVVCGDDEKIQWKREGFQKDMERVEKYIDDRVKKEVTSYNLSVARARPTVASFWAVVDQIKKRHDYICLYYTGHGSEKGICLQDGTVPFKKLAPMFYRVVLSCSHSGGAQRAVPEKVHAIPIFGAISSLTGVVPRQHPRHLQMKFYTATTAMGRSHIQKEKGSYFDRWTTEKLSWSDLVKNDNKGVRKVITVEWNKVLAGRLR